jgi:hypothetical protein
MRGQGIDLDILLQEATELQEKANQRVQLSDAKLINFRLKGSKKVADAEVKNDKESKDKQKDELSKFLAAKEKAENDFLDSQLSKQDQEENKVRDKYFSLIEQAIQFGEDTAILEEAQLTQIQEIRDRFAEEAKEKQAQEDQERKEKREEQVQSAIDSAENLVKIAESVNTIFHGKELKRIEEKKKRGEQLTKSEIRRLQKEEKIQKAFALAQVAIDTARAISGAVAVGAKAGPFPGNLVAIITGVTAALAGVAQASQILGSGSAISSGGGSDAATIEDAAGGATEAAPLSTVQEGSTLLNQQPQQVVVVEAITEGIKSVGVIEAQATFG